jgi:hypothetical protein
VGENASWPAKLSSDFQNRPFSSSYGPKTDFWFSYVANVAAPVRNTTRELQKTLFKQIFWIFFLILVLIGFPTRIWFTILHEIEARTNFFTFLGFPVQNLRKPVEKKIPPNFFWPISKNRFHLNFFHSTQNPKTYFDFRKKIFWPKKKFFFRNFFSRTSGLRS